MPERVECRYCGSLNDVNLTECSNCGATLADSFKRVVCDRCGIPLPDGTASVGRCVVCSKDVYLCRKHKKRVENDEVYCREHESECFIATAVFGTPLDPKIDILRSLRDEWLSSNPLGRLLILSYYEISPPIANRIRRDSNLKRVMRKVLVDPALRAARHLVK